MAIKRYWLGPVLALLLVAGGIYSSFVRVPNATQTTQTTSNGGQPMLVTKHITVGALQINAEIADTQLEQISGLSGRDSLPEGQGMLFVFPEAADIGFWMKDMKFPIDMVFADETGSIVTIAANTTPDTYPQTFHPTKPAKYVLELPAGFSSAHGIAVGQKIVVQ